MSYASEAGLIAVRAKFGGEVEQRIRNWPRIARELATAYCDDQQTIDARVREAEDALAKACANVEWALDQAGMIARAGIANDRIPSASLIRKWDEGLAEDSAHELRAWGKREDVPAKAADSDTFGAWLREQQERWGGKHPGWENCRECKS